MSDELIYKKVFGLVLIIFIVVGIASISGCTSSGATCPNCGSNDVRDVGPYTNPTTNEDEQGYICNNCDFSFGVPK